MKFKIGTSVIINVNKITNKKRFGIIISHKNKIKICGLNTHCEYCFDSSVGAYIFNKEIDILCCSYKGNYVEKWNEDEE